MNSCYNDKFFHKKWGGSGRPSRPASDSPGRISLPQQAGQVDRDQEGRKENLTAAIKLVQSKELTTAQASRRFGVRYTTLQDHVKGISQKIGAGCPTVLTRAEEQ